MLSRKYKLKKDKDFKRVFKQGRYFQQDFIGIKILKNDLVINRFGLIIGLKISKKATQRNKIKRQLEGIIQLKLEQISPGFDIVILPGPEILTKNYQEIEKTLMDLLKQTKLLCN